MGAGCSPPSFEALTRMRRALREQAATLHQAPHKPKVPEDGAMLFRRAVADAPADPWDWEAVISTGEELFFSRPGVPTAALRKLRRGGWVIQANPTSTAIPATKPASRWPPSSTAACSRTGAACASSMARAMARKTACRC